MEKLKQHLEALISELEDSEAIYERLENLMSVYPFNEYEYMISTLLGRDKLSLDDGVDFKEVTLDPASAEGPMADDTIRPGGQTCCARAWSSGRWSPTAATDLTLLLTEFTDPGGEATHLRVPAPEAAVAIDDELMQPCMQ